VGAGTLPRPALARAAPATWIVEHDAPADDTRFAGASIGFLQSRRTCSRRPPIDPPAAGAQIHGDRVTRNPMDELTIHPGFLQSLILKTRALMAQEELVSPDSGSNPTDDEGGPTTLQEDPDNLIRDELIAEIEDLEPDQQAELVALMWIGRGDMEPEEWEDALALAVERHEGATGEYLLSHPHVADYWDEGLDKLFDGSDLVETGEY
jgi:hypothetical protein